MQTKSPAIGSVIVTNGALFIAAFVALTFANWPSIKPVRNLTVVYVDADNCAPCEIWQRNPDTAFLDSPEFHRLAYREVKSPYLFDVLKDNNWPEELRGYRQAIGDVAVMPLWLVIADDLPLVDECNRAVGTATKQLVRHNDAPISEALDE